VTGWRDQAACLDVDPEAFFPASRYGHAYRAQVAAALAVCRGCPVVDACREDAIATRDIEFGVRAAMTPEQRRELARPRARADRDAQTARAVAELRRLPAAAWHAIAGADGRGNLPVHTSTVARHALVAAGLADETLSGRRHTSAVRLNAAGRALREQNAPAGATS